tara:strand:+ start:1097 stop:1420 length:324 start_codon:yes stop_codon:yes gene_type:complete
MENESEKGTRKKKKTTKQKGGKKETQENVSDNTQQQQQQPIVHLPLDFVKHINNVLLTANQRAHWNPEELIPVGTVLRELNALIIHYERALSEKDERKSGTSTPKSS